MKRLILFFTALLLTVSVFGQEEEKKKELFPPFPISFDEFTISGNRTIALSGERGRLGCGAGIYHSSVLSKRWHYLYGLEYNYTSVFIGDVALPATTHRIEKNVTFHIHAVSLMPVSFRFSMGKNVKYFIESGVFLGFSIADKKGDAYLINPLPTPENPDSYILVKMERDKGMDYGHSFGMGMRIPMKNIEWIVKADYKLGISLMTGYETYQYCRLGIGIRTTKRKAQQ